MSADLGQLNRPCLVSAPLPAANISADPAQLIRRYLVRAPLPTATRSADPGQLNRRRLINAVENCRRKLVTFENFADSLNHNLKDEFLLRQRQVSLHKLNAIHRKHITALGEAIRARSSSCRTMAFEVTDPSQSTDRVSATIEIFFNQTEATAALQPRLCEPPPDSRYSEDQAPNFKLTESHVRFGPPFAD
jgi:hypothetical protein